MSDDPTLDRLKKQIQEAKKTSQSGSFKGNMSQNFGGKFFNVGVELVAGIIVGVGLGLIVDWVCGTSPWGLISLFIFGSIAGMLNVYRTLTRKSPVDKKDMHV
ncbi:MAG: AtpZ/AtpI family protein [Alphaproteobacteria bacterium]|jgi:ATP synthase protein I|nr:AtpZ/AtpI family protein [Alphaproteobacteria bacterium]MBP7729429.1 AtpZ/AtpI family protein [Alphaproteobacteria bacterium]